MGPTGKSNQIKGMPARLFQPHHLAAQLSYREPEPVAADDHPCSPPAKGALTMAHWFAFLEGNAYMVGGVTAKWLTLLWAYLPAHGGIWLVLALVAKLVCTHGP